MFIGFSSNRSKSLYSGPSVRTLVSSDNPFFGQPIGLRAKPDSFKQAASTQQSVRKSGGILRKVHRLKPIHV
jgi:hypothetical protein